MCGIFSVIGHESSSKDLIVSQVALGLDRIKHRGPDGMGLWVNPNESVGFGHVRLTIVDLVSGAQPMSLEDGTTIIFNGEIYIN